MHVAILRPMGMLALSVPLLAGCSTYPAWLPASGPGLEQVTAQEEIDPRIPVIAVSDTVARRMMAAQKRERFSEAFPGGRMDGHRVGPGDVIEVSVWEAPPAALFGAASLDSRGGVTTARVTTLPEQMISPEGRINVPFAGSIDVDGKSPQQIEAWIADRLKHKANQPQVMVRVIRNATSNVTIVGEVGQSQRMQLTAKGERLLDAVAAAGGVRHPVGKTMVQISRDGKVLAMPLESVIQDPAQNVHLKPGDVLTALFQSSSFTVLGAAGKNDEVGFEAQGITLAQALARAGGLRDHQADARGLFIFRFEEPGILPQSVGQPYAQTPEGKIPVVYQMNLRDPRSFLVAQNFPVKNQDVLYVANAPSAELQKFLGLLTSSIYSISNTINLSK